MRFLATRMLATSISLAAFSAAQYPEDPNGNILLSGSVSGVIENTGAGIKTSGPVVLTGSTTLRTFGGRVLIQHPITCDIEHGSNGSGSSPGGHGDSGFNLTIQTQSIILGQPPDVSVSSPVDLSGRNGGNGGTGARGGDGGNGGDFTVLARGEISVGKVYTFGGDGGPGGNDPEGSGGAGGRGGDAGDVSIRQRTTAITGSTNFSPGRATDGLGLLAFGGGGGSGGDGESGGGGGGGGNAGSVTVRGRSVVSLSSDFLAHGGHAGGGGDSTDTVGGAAGNGGTGGDLSFTAMSDDVSTSVNAAELSISIAGGDGGNGGSGGYGILCSASGFAGGSGGSGGASGSATISGYSGTSVDISELQLSAWGGLGRGGGHGGPSGSCAPGGAGGSGGLGAPGGSFSVSGSSTTYVDGAALSTYGGKSGSGGDGGPVGGSGGSPGSSASGGSVTISGTIVGSYTTPGSPWPSGSSGETDDSDPCSCE